MEVLFRVKTKKVKVKTNSNQVYVFSADGTIFIGSNL